MKNVITITLSLFFYPLWSQSTSGKNLILEKDQKILSALNAKFIHNFITQDVKEHDKIIHADFVCIENTGRIVGREDYLKNWATDYQNAALDTFYHTEELIRIFGNVALVRSKSIFQKTINGKSITGASIYTDTYFKEKGIWKCIQAHMTPVNQ